MDIELLRKYINNCCTSEELSNVLTWFTESACTNEGKAILYKVWEELYDEDIDTTINFDLLLDKIHHKVNISESKKLIVKAGQDLINYKKREFLVTIITKAAAILLLPVMGFGLYMYINYQSVRNTLNSAKLSYNEVVSSVDAITKVSLPDGSYVWLNHSSSLKYPAKFQGDSRTVELTGEGYFEVVHDSKIPFVVKMKEIQIVAHGTTFNILAYPDEDRIETSLINGNVEMQMPKPGGKSVTVLKMKPTDITIYDKGTNEFTTHTTKDDRHFAWKEGKLVFKKESMEEVVKKLNRWFNVDIQVNDTDLFEFTYTATFSNETLYEVMELLTLVSPVDYTISNREALGDGTFTKRKVTLKHRTSKIIDNNVNSLTKKNCL
jgi:transmembrane sensor